MKEYDVIVIGAGDVGLGIVFKALSARLRVATTGMKVALVEKGKVGGTCVNVGCVPSKTLIFPADIIAEIQQSKKLGVYARITRIDFDSIMKRMKKAVGYAHNFLRNEIKNSANLDFYDEETHFVGDYTLEVKGERIKGKKIFIATGARPFIPPVKGLDKIDYLTNKSVLEIKKRPESMIIIGGGYVGVEYGHFFASIGTKVTILQRNQRLVPAEEPEISELLKKEMSRRMKINTNTETLDVRKVRGGYAVSLRDKDSSRTRNIVAEKIMVASGRKSNADLLKVENTGVETNEAGFIKVDDYLQTRRENIWALGDAIGKQMFTHAGDKEAEIVWHNAETEEKIKMDFSIVPHAVFTHPQIAAVGLTEEQARKDYEILVGKAKYSDTVMGEAMGEENGFAKAIVEKESKKILGFHIIGPEASILIQEIVNAMAKKDDIKSITENMHIFPALSELIPETLKNLE